ncbi:hypothetical protein [Caudoviricetes sp.]|nr:hypothetical protein [Caudoviricetes sp.]
MNNALPFFFGFLIFSFVVGCISIAIYNASKRTKPPQFVRFRVVDDQLYGETWNGQLEPVIVRALDETTRSRYRSIAFKQWIEEREALGSPPRSIGNDWLRSVF